MKRHKTSNSGPAVIKQGQIVSTVKACRKIKADINPFKRNPATPAYQTSGIVRARLEQQAAMQAELNPPQQGGAK